MQRGKVKLERMQSHQRVVRWSLFFPTDAFLLLNFYLPLEFLVGPLANDPEVFRIQRQAKVWSESDRRRDDASTQRIGKKAKARSGAVC